MVLWIRSPLEFKNQNESIKERHARQRVSILASLRAGIPIKRAISSAGLTNYLFLSLLKSGEAAYRNEVLALLPSRAMEPVTEFGRWCLMCEKTRGAVGFDGDLRIPDVASIAQRVRHSDWPKDKRSTEPLDCLVCGPGANPVAYLDRLAPGAVILGVGVGPQFDGWTVKHIDGLEGRYFRMARA